MRKILTVLLIALMLFGVFVVQSTARDDGDWGQRLDGEFREEPPDPYEWTYFIEDGKYYRYRTEEGDRNKCVEVDEEEYIFVEGKYQLPKIESDTTNYTWRNIGVALSAFGMGIITTLVLVKLKKGRKPTVGEETTAE